MAAQLGTNHMMVARVWKRAGLKPHRLDRYIASTDPDFETRLEPVLPLSPGRAERHGFEYYRRQR